MEQEIKRLTDFLAAIYPGSVEYARTLANLKTLYEIKELEKYCRVEAPEITEIPITEPTPVAEPVSATVVAEATPVVTAKVVADGDYTKEYVKNLLIDVAKNKGVQIQPILAKYIPEGSPSKFSSVPADKYKELVEELNNAG